MSRQPSNFMVGATAIGIVLATVALYLGMIAAIVFVVVKVLQWTGVL